MRRALISASMPLACFGDASFCSFFGDFLGDFFGDLLGDSSAACSGSCSCTAICTFSPKVGMMVGTIWFIEALRAMTGFCARDLPGVPTGTTDGESTFAIGEDADLRCFFGDGDCFFGETLTLTLTLTDADASGDSGGSSASSTGEQVELLRASDEFEALRASGPSGVCLGEPLFASRSPSGVFTTAGDCKQTTRCCSADRCG